MDAKVGTEGRRLLLATPGTEGHLAAKIGCSPAVVGHWRRGRRIPGPAHRHKLELLFGIPQRAWEVASGTQIPTEPTAPPETAPPDPGTDTLTITKNQIDGILLTLEEEALTEPEAAKLRDTVAKLLALRARLERDRDLLEDRVVRQHPHWARTKAAILLALKPYPEAAAAVAEALR